MDKIEIINDQDNDNVIDIDTSNQILTLYNYNKFVFLKINHFQLIIDSNRIDNVQ
jgi:hypothetical protein